MIIIGSTLSRLYVGACFQLFRFLLFFRRRSILRIVYIRIPIKTDAAIVVSIVAFMRIVLLRMEPVELGI